MPASAGGGGGVEPDLAELERRTRSALRGLLAPRERSARVGVLGAGSDDVDSGRRYLALLAPGGYRVPAWPVEHGGMALGAAAAEVVRSVLAELEAPDLYAFLVGLDLVGPTLLAHAGADQLSRWLPGIRDGSEVWCQLFSEPDAGSDLAGLRSSARRDGDGWLVSGSKVWTSRARYAGRGLLLARHDPSLPKHRGITAFGLDMGSPGISVRPLVQMNRDAHFAEVFLDGVRVPDSDRIGGPGEGWRVALTCLSFERGALGGSLGVQQEQLLRLGRSPRTDPVARDELARRVAELKVIAVSGSRAEQARLAGRPPGPEGSASKLRAAAMVKGVSALAMRVEGPASVASDPAGAPAAAGGGPAPGDDGEWQGLFLAGPSLSIRGGTDEIQRNILGERVLGLPPEPRPDREGPFAADR